MNPRGRRDAGRPLVVDPASSARLGRIRQSGTVPEIRVREILRELGIRSGRTKKRLPGRPDIVNLSAGWCIFVHGCFWHAHHGCPRATLPKRNRAFWRAKFQANRARDVRALRALPRLGLRPCVVWECELVEKRKLVRLRLLKHALRLNLRRSRPNAPSV